MNIKDALAQVEAALESIHNPLFSNEKRKEAQNFLDEGFFSSDSLPLAIELIKDTETKEFSKHFGLGVLDKAVKSKWLRLSAAEKQWLLTQVGSIVEEHYVKGHLLEEKLASVVSDIAKQEWYRGWRDFDEWLQRLWVQDLPSQLMVINILNDLIHDVYILKDPIAEAGHDYLPILLITSMASENDLHQVYSEASGVTVLENLLGKKWGIPGNVGWIRRWLLFYQQQVSGKTFIGSPLQERTPALLAMEAISSSLSWCLENTLRQSNVIEHLYLALDINDTKLQMLVLEGIQNISKRKNSSSDDRRFILESIISPNNLQKLHGLYLTTVLIVEKDFPEDPTDAAYCLLKKLSESLVNIVNNLPSDIGLSVGICTLATEILKHPSIIVATAGIDIWNHILNRIQSNPSSLLDTFLFDILNISACRMERVDEIPEMTPTAKYLYIDYETVPERHSMVGKYRRMNYDLVCQLFKLRPTHSLEILNVPVQTFLSNPLPAGSSGINKAIALQSDAICFVIRAVLAGAKSLIQDRKLKDALSYQDLERLRQWFEELIYAIQNDTNRRNPVVMGSQIFTMIAFMDTLPDSSRWAVAVMETVAQSLTVPYSLTQSQSTVASIAEERAKAGEALIKLLKNHPQYYSQHFQAIKDSLQQIFLQPNCRKDTKSVLLTARMIIGYWQAPNDWKKNLEEFIEFLRIEWNSPFAEQCLENQTYFLQLLKVEQLAGYMRARRIQLDESMSNVLLDEEGINLYLSFEKNTGFTWVVKGLYDIMTNSIDLLESDSQKSAARAYWYSQIENHFLTGVISYFKLIQSLSAAQSGTSVESDIVTYLASQQIRWVFARSADESEAEADRPFLATLEDFLKSQRRWVDHSRDECLRLLGALFKSSEYFYRDPAKIQAILNSVFTSEPMNISIMTWSTIISDLLTPIVVGYPQSLILDHITQPLGQDFKLLLDLLDAKLTAEWEICYQRNNTGIDYSDDRQISSDLSDEITGEVQIRRLTYITVKFLDAMLGDGRRASPFSQFVMRLEAVLMAFTRLICNILMFRDYRSVELAVRMLGQLFVNSEPSSAFQEEGKTWMATRIFPVIIKLYGESCRNEKTETRDLALSLIVRLYGHFRERSTLIKETLMSLPSQTLDSFTAFDKDFSGVKTQKERRNFIIKYLRRSMS